MRWSVHPSIWPLPPNLSFILLLRSLPPNLPPPSPVRRQRWDEGGGDPEEPERRAAGAGLPAGPQPAVLAAPAGAQPQPAGGVDLPQRGVLPGQTALQLSDAPETTGRSATGEKL